MKRLIILLILQGFCYASNSQTEKIILVSNWKKGDIKNYEIKSYFKLDAENEAKVNNRELKHITIEVLEVDSELVKIKWNSYKSEIKDSSSKNQTLSKFEKSLDSVSTMINQDNPFSSFVKNMDSTLTIYYTVGKSSAKIRVTNIDEIVDKISSKGQLFLSNFIKTNNLDKDKAEMITFQFGMMFLRKESIETLVLDDIKKFHQIYGYEFLTTETTTIPDDIFAPNDNGIPSNSLDLKLSSVDLTNMTIKIEGTLRCTEKNERLRNFLQNMRDMNYTYIFKSP
jgi:hypothetical protein